MLCPASALSIPPVLRSEAHPVSLLHCGHSYLVSGGEVVGGAAVSPQSHRYLTTGCLFLSPFGPRCSIGVILPSSVAILEMAIPSLCLAMILVAFYVPGH